MDKSIIRKERHPNGVSLVIYGNEMPDQVGHDYHVITGLTGNLLLIKCSSNVNGTCYSTTYHRVVTDAEESHHLNVCWNRRQTECNKT